MVLEDRFLQQLKKGVLEMLVLEAVCEAPTYGYALLTGLKERTAGMFTLKEGTLYPILYRLEDDGLIESCWSTPQGRAGAKKMYAATEAGQQARRQRHKVWKDFIQAVDGFYEKGGEKT